MTFIVTLNKVLFGDSNAQQTKILNVLRIIKKPNMPIFVDCLNCTRLSDMNYGETKVIPT